MIQSYHTLSYVLSHLPTPLRSLIFTEGYYPSRIHGLLLRTQEPISPLHFYFLMASASLEKAQSVREHYAKMLSAPLQNLKGYVELLYYTGRLQFAVRLQVDYTTGDTELAYYASHGGRMAYDKWYLELRYQVAVLDNPLTLPSPLLNHHCRVLTEKLEDAVSE
jgi:hypothetical protein